MNYPNNVGFVVVFVSIFWLIHNFKDQYLEESGKLHFNLTINISGRIYTCIYVKKKKLCKPINEKKIAKFNYKLEEMEQRCQLALWTLSGCWRYFKHINVRSPAW